MQSVITKKHFFFIEKVGEPNPPRSINSSVFFINRSLASCEVINFLNSSVSKFEFSAILNNKSS